MTRATEGLRRSFASEAASVGAARWAVADFAAGLGMTEPRLDDLKTTVSEASGNVVRHAYPIDAGRFEVEAHAGDGLLTVIVRDSGVGLRPDPGTEGPRPRLGLGLISVLADGYSIRSRRDGGTEVRMTLML